MPYRPSAPLGLCVCTCFCCGRFLAWEPGIFHVPQSVRLLGSFSHSPLKAPPPHPSSSPSLSLSLLFMPQLLDPSRLVCVSVVRMCACLSVRQRQKWKQQSEATGGTTKKAVGMCPFFYFLCLFQHSSWPSPTQQGDLVFVKMTEMEREEGKTDRDNSGWAVWMGGVAAAAAAAALECLSVFLF